MSARLIDEFGRQLVRQRFAAGEAEKQRREAMKKEKAVSRPRKTNKAPASKKFAAVYYPDEDGTYIIVPSANVPKITPGSTAEFRFGPERKISKGTVVAFGRTKKEAELAFDDYKEKLNAKKAGLKKTKKTPPPKIPKERRWCVMHFDEDNTIIVEKTEKSRFRGDVRKIVIPHGVWRKYGDKWHEANVVAFGPTEQKAIDFYEATCEKAERNQIAIKKNDKTAVQATAKPVDQPASAADDDVEEEAAAEEIEAVAQEPAAPVNEASTMEVDEVEETDENADADESSDIVDEPSDDEENIVVVKKVEAPCKEAPLHLV